MNKRQFAFFIIKCQLYKHESSVTSDHGQGVLDNIKKFPDGDLLSVCIYPGCFSTQSIMLISYRAISQHDGKERRKARQENE